MFFNASHFRKILPQREAEIVADTANEVIRNQGKTVYGIKFKDGSLDYFSSNQTHEDQHVGVLIGLKLMGSFDDDRVADTGHVEKDDLVESLEHRAAMLERENRQLRGKSQE